MIVLKYHFVFMTFIRCLRVNIEIMVWTIDPHFVSASYESSISSATIVWSFVDRTFLPSALFYWLVRVEASV